MSSPEHPGQSEPLWRPHDHLSVATGFDIAELARQRTEPALEVAGPTERHGKTGLAAYTIWQDLPPVPFYVSNILKPHSAPGKLDLRLNAAQLPFLNRSLGIIAASKLPDLEIRGSDDQPVTTLHRAFMSEAKRCLVPDGLLVMAGVDAAKAWWSAWRLGVTVLCMLQLARDPILHEVIFLNRKPAFDQKYTNFAVPARP